MLLMKVCLKVCFYINLSTYFPVEWSTDPDFGTVSGVREVLDVRQTEVSIDGLTHGQCFYFRAACGNIRGYSHLRHSQPDCVIPSSEYNSY